MRTTGKLQFLFSQMIFSLATIALLFKSYTPISLRETLVFLRNSAIQEKFSFSFFRIFLLVLTKFSFSEEDWTLGYNSMKF